MITRAQQKKFFALARETGEQNARMMLRAVTKGRIRSTRDRRLTPSMMNDVLGELEKLTQRGA